MWDVPRQHERISVSLEVVWEAASGKHNARISDISMGGCYIDSIGQVNVGETMVFQVQLPTGPWVQLRGEVAHYFQGVGFGLRFGNLKEEERILIEQVILAHGGKLIAHQSSIEEKEARPTTSKITAAGRVLIADDDPTIIHLTTVVIQKEGYTVVPARDGREAYNILRSDAAFVAAIFDMMMPHVQGIDLVRYMRMEQRLAHIPVGIMTAEQDPKLWHDSFAAGAGIFLPKPFTTAQMRYMLRVLLSQSRA